MTTIKNLSPRRLQRLRRLDVLLARGGYTTRQLSELFGVSYAEIEEDIEYIREEWWKERERERTRDLRVRRIREIEHIKNLALSSFEISRQEKTTTTTDFVDEPCQECEGTGKLLKMICPECKGERIKTKEVTITQVEGKPGDNTFLNTAMGALREICRLEALYEQPIQLVKHQVHGQVDVLVEEKTYLNVDPETILRAKAALEQLDMAEKQNVVKNLEAPT